MITEKKINLQLHNNLNNGQKIPCVVIIYNVFDFIKKTLEYLMQYEDVLDFYIIENRSNTTDSIIKPYILELIKKQKVKKYFLFESNISNNAIETALNSKEIDLNSSEYVLLTDSDLLPENDEWLDEQISILRNNPEVFCCGVDLTLTNLPVEIIPSSVNWYPKSISIQEDYIEGVTGHHLILLRNNDLKAFLNYQTKSNVKYRDSEIHKYCYSILRRKWARTKIAKVRHLKWDIVTKELNHDYLKKKQRVKDRWNHDLHSGYEVYGQQSYYIKYDVPDFLMSGSVFYDDPKPSKKIQFSPPYKLNLGCNSNRKIDGWINIDSRVKPGITDLKIDVIRGLPFDNNSCDLIYHQNKLEKCSVSESLILLKECYRVLQKGGVMRIAMPSLDVVIEKCYLGNWKDQEWLKIPQYKPIQTRAEMLNILFRSWGTKWLYDREELHRRLEEAGFKTIKDLELQKSDIAELRNLETRKDSLLICEAYKL